MPDVDGLRRARGLRVGLRAAVVLLLGVALISLAALSGEYPGDSSAGRRVVLREVFPLAAVAWVNLILLEVGPGSAAARWWTVVAVIGDAALLATAVTRAWGGGPPLTVVMPGIAAVLLVCSAGVGLRSRDRAEGAGGAS